MKTKNNQIKIRTSYETLAAAVNASGMDLSYNKGEAERKIARLDRDNKAEHFLLAEDGSVYYSYKAPDGLVLLHKFSPFCSCISEDGFVLAILERNEHGLFLKRNTGGEVFTRCRKAMSLIVSMASTVVSPAFAMTPSST